MVLKKKTILVIDDDPDFRNFVRVLLESKGMEVIEASTLDEAHTKLQERTPNIILLDMELENESGIDFLQERAIKPGLSRIPVVVCSSQNLSTVVLEAIRNGADDYLLKPMKQPWLMQRIRKHLINEVELSYTFPDGEEAPVQMAIDAQAVFMSGDSFLARSQMGFGKNVVAQIDVSTNKGLVTCHFKSAEKSRFSTKGPFDTLLTERGLDSDEKARLKMLKTFWSES